MPNPFSFIDTINLQDAQASSAIENILTTQDALFQASVANKKIDNPKTKEVIHYKDAVWYGVEQIKKKLVMTIKTSGVYLNSLEEKGFFKSVSDGRKTISQL